MKTIQEHNIEKIYVTEAEGKFYFFSLYIIYISLFLLIFSSL